jgi:hypothetical protein
MVLSKSIRRQKKKTVRRQKKKTVRKQRKKTVRKQRKKTMRKQKRTKLRGGDSETCVERGRYKCSNCVGKNDPITLQAIKYNDNPMCIDKQCYGESALRDWLQHKSSVPHNNTNLTHAELYDIIDSPDKCVYYDSSDDELEEVLSPLQNKRLREKEATEKYGRYWYMQDNEFTRN